MCRIKFRFFTYSTPKTKRYWLSLFYDLLHKNKYKNNIHKENLSIAILENNKEKRIIN